MRNLKLFASHIKRHGFKSGLSKLTNYVSRRLSHRYKSIRLTLVSDHRKVFNEIYKLNWWGNNESISGVGSTLEYTKNLRMQLPVLFDKFRIESVFDAPCGDFNWMRHVLSKSERVQYIGGDIVEELIRINSVKYKSKNISFTNFDIVNDVFPKVDLWICRDCFFHLPEDMILKSLLNFLESGSSYLLSTTHKNHNFFDNINVKPGGFRLIDLFAEPYFFPRNVLYRFDDWLSPEPEREMCMWSRDQIHIAVKKMCAYAKS